MHDAPRVLLADEQPVTRLGIRIALEHGGVLVVAEAATARETVAAAHLHDADVCLVDVGLPGGGIAAASEIAAALPRTRVIVLTVARSDDDLLAALRAGAIGYLLKDIGPDQLVRVVRGALRGEAALSRQLAGRVVEELQTRSGARRVRTSDGGLATLSPRESLVLELLRRGLTTKQIAQRIGVSPVTVRRHLSTTVHRLGVEDRAAALRATSPAVPS